jgi:uncharacterized membrane protein YphA (DoxX/SURF4 family)
MLLAFMGFYLSSLNGAAGMKADIGVFLVFPVTIIVYQLVRILSQLIRNKYTMHGHTAGMLEAFVVTVCVVFGILCRLSAVAYLNMTLNANLSDPASFSLPIRDIIQVPYETYYDMAVVRAGGQLTSLTHGAGYLYVCLVSAVCSFLGNKLISAMYLQLVIQLVSIVIAYLAVRKAAGRLPACIVMLYLSFSNTYISEIGKISPDSLVFLLYLLGVLIMVSYVKDYCDNCLARSELICGALFVGIVTGILVSLDMKMVILFVYLVGLFTGKKKIGEEEYDHHKVIDLVIALIVTLVSCTAALCAAFGITAWNRHISFEQAAANWFSFYLTKSQVSLYYNMTQLNRDLPMLTVVLMAASFLIFEFFRKGKEQNFMLWILAGLAIAPVPMMELGVLPYAMISVFQWCVLAGLGVQNCVFGNQAETMQAKIEAINAAAEPIAEKQAPAVTETEVLQPQKETMQAKIEAINAAAEPIAEKPIPAAAETEKIQTPEEPQPQTAEPIHYIENPLPLPKKHVKKEMDYQYSVAEADMKYDVEVDDADDYDIP